MLATPDAADTSSDARSGAVCDPDVEAPCAAASGPAVPHGTSSNTSGTSGTTARGAYSKTKPPPPPSAPARTTA